MKSQLPPWLLPVIAITGLLILALAISQAITGFDKPVGKDITVRPGMYNMREEMQKPQNPNKRGKTNGASPSPPGASS